MCTNGAISSGHHLASLSGLKILQKGGNVFDAALAASAVLCVVQPEMCGLGGDAFILAYESESHKLRAINAGGKAPTKGTIDEFTERSYQLIPEEGNLAASVPGLVKAWAILYENYCTRSLAELLADAILYAKVGFPIYNNLLTHIASARRKLERCAATARLFLPNLKLPSLGSLLVQNDLSLTLSRLSEEGLESFYEGTATQLIGQSSRKADGLSY
jgi:gamma-glutamyltranspeptidase / glutathione hydrolase